MAKVKNQTSKIVTMVERDMDQVKKRQKAMKVISKIMVYVFLGIMAVVVLFPFVPVIPII